MTVVGWSIVLFYGVSTGFGSFNAEINHFGGSYGILTVVVYLRPNPFLYIKTVLFQAV